MNTVPVILVDMLLLGEDRRFWLHNGIDLLGSIRAAVRTVLLGKLEGGSTIQQQLLRTVTGQRAKTLRRKIREVFLAPLVESVVPKGDVPGLYLSLAYFGTGMTGWRQVCKRLGFPEDRLSPRQAADIIARLKYPEPTLPNPATKRNIQLRSAYLIRLYEAQLAGRVRRISRAQDRTMASPYR